MRDTEKAEKKRFAAALLHRPFNAFEVAQSILGETNPKAWDAAQTWPNDQVVIDEQQRLIEENGEDFYLMNRSGVLRHCSRIADNPKSDAKDVVNALKLAAEILGCLQKPGVSVEVNNAIQSRVMVVTDSGSEAQWEAKLQAQQAALMDDGLAARA